MDNTSRMDSTVAPTTSSTVATWPMDVSKAESIKCFFTLTLWLIYCCMGSWEEPFRLPTLTLNIARRVCGIYIKPLDLCLGLFVTYLLGRTKISDVRVWW